jgi:hypothetical protein
MNKTIFMNEDWSLSKTLENVSPLNVENRIQLFEEIKKLDKTNDVNWDAVESKMIKVVEVGFSEILLPMCVQDEDPMNEIKIYTANLELTHTLEFGKAKIKSFVKKNSVADSYIIINDPNEYEILLLKYPGI